VISLKSDDTSSLAEPILTDKSLFSGFVSAKKHGWKTGVGLPPMIMLLV